MFPVQFRMHLLLPPALQALPVEHMTAAAAVDLIRRPITLRADRAAHMASPVVSAAPAPAAPAAAAAGASIATHCRTELMPHINRNRCAQENCSSAYQLLVCAARCASIQQNYQLNTEPNMDISIMGDKEPIFWV